MNTVNRVIVIAFVVVLFSFVSGVVLNLDTMGDGQFWSAVLVLPILLVAGGSLVTLLFAPSPIEGEEESY